jgi:hypothetical protein
VFNLLMAFYFVKRFTLHRQATLLRATILGLGLLGSRCRQPVAVAVALGHLMNVTVEVVALVLIPKASSLTFLR